MTSPSGQRTWPAEILTPAEVGALIAACSVKSRTGIRNRALVKILYKSGLRISEVIGYPGRGEVQIGAPDGSVKIQKPRDPIPPLKETHINFAQHDIRILHTKERHTADPGISPVHRRQPAPLDGCPPGPRPQRPPAAFLHPEGLSRFARPTSGRCSAG
jgi:hypothetical protein